MFHFLQASKACWDPSVLLQTIMNLIRLKIFNKFKNEVLLQLLFSKWRLIMVFWYRLCIWLKEKSKFKIYVDLFQLYSPLPLYHLGQQCSIEVGRFLRKFHKEISMFGDQPLCNVFPLRHRLKDEAFGGSNRQLPGHFNLLSILWDQFCYWLVLVIQHR